MPSSRLIRWLPVGFVFLVGVLSIRLIGPQVPSEIYLLTGPEESALHADGQQYKRYLEGRGVRVNLVETGGSVDNLRALVARDRPQAGFVEAGTEAVLGLDESVEGLTSLGSLSVEPLWLFVRADLPVGSLEDLRGLRVALGPEGSAASRIAREVLKLNGVADEVASGPFESLTAQAAADAIMAGDVDAIFAISAPESGLLQCLLRSDLLKPVSFRRSAAYERRMPYLAAVTLPEGTIDLALNIPDADLQQLAASVNLVTDEDMPPVLVDLLLEAGAVIHGGRTLYTNHGAFPSPDHISLPLNEAAADFYRTGPSPLRRVLPFWLATIVDRFLGFAAAVGGTALAVFSLLPRLLGLRFQVSANGYWRRLEKLEKQRAAGESDEVILAELDEILRESADLKAPLNLKPAYFELRQEMHDMRDRLTG
jgi:TRAP-type uncharacterized transport system substrate-binding protein